jgi:hypothetical protein
MVGASANPSPPSVVSALGSFVSSIQGVVEAHLVQCRFTEFPNIDCQAIVVVVENIDLVHSTVDRIVQWLNESLPNGMTLYVWPMGPSNAILPLVRDADCMLFSCKLKEIHTAIDPARVDQ